MRSYKQQLRRQHLTSGPWFLILSLPSSFIYNPCHKIEEMHWRNVYVRRLKKPLVWLACAYYSLLCGCSATRGQKSESHTWGQDLWRAPVEPCAQSRPSHISFLTALSSCPGRLSFEHLQGWKSHNLSVPLFQHLPTSTLMFSLCNYKEIIIF